MEENLILADTSAYSAFVMENPDAKRLIQEADGIFINPVVLGELFSGFAGGKLERRNRSFLGRFLSSPRVKVLNIDEETSERYAKIAAYLRANGTPIPTNDIWIAATAMQHGLKILTSDAHFLKVPQVITDYFPV